MIEYVSSWFTPTVLFCVLNLVIGTILLSSTFKPHHNKQNEYQLGHDNSVQLARAPSLLERVRSINSFRRDDPIFDQFSYAQNTPLLARAPSLLRRVGSFNFSFFHSQQPDPISSGPPENETRPVSVLERVRSIKFSFSRSDQPDPVQSTTRYDDPPESQARKIRKAVEVEEVVEPETSETETDISQPRRAKSEACAEAPAGNGKKPKMKKWASAKIAAAGEETQDDVDRRRPATVREKTASFEEDEAVDEKADDFINMFRQQLKLQRLDSLLRYKETLHRRVGN